MGMRLTFIILLILLAGCGRQPAYDAELLQQWNAAKAELGSTFAGGPGWQDHLDVLEAGFADAAVVDIEKVLVPYRRWWAPDRPMPGQRSLVVGGESVPVASYWAYSGSTSAAGITAPLLIYEKGMTSAQLAGRIVVFQVGHVPDSMGQMFKVGREYATDDFAKVDTRLVDDQWYQSNYVTRFGRFDSVLRESGAVGAVVVFAMSAARLEGLYTFPLLELGVIGVPGLYVDQVAGAGVLAAAEKGMPATLTLRAHEEDVEPYFYTAVLPGRAYGTAADEQILLVTHSDGPNLTQENGTLGILALVRHYARLPQSERPRSLRVLLDPQHYSPGRHVLDWYERHPDIMRTVVASLGVEHIGQREYGEADSSFGLTGLAEPWLIYARDDPQLIAAAIDAIEATGLPRTELRVPERKGQGRWTGLGDVALKHDLAAYATLSNMSGYWGTNTGIESFDADLAKQQLDCLVMLIDMLMLFDPEST
jgi:hypothetical protein